PATFEPTLPLTSLPPLLPAWTPVTVTGVSGSLTLHVPLNVSAVEDGFEPVAVEAARSPTALVSSAASLTVRVSGDADGEPSVSVIVNVVVDWSPSLSVIVSGNVSMPDAFACAT